MATDLFVADFRESTSIQTLKKAFAAHGWVLDVRILRDRETRAPRGFAFVRMASEREARAALAALHGSTLEGATLRVHLANRQPDGATVVPQELVVYVGNLPSEINERTLRDLLGAGGRDVRRLHLLRDRDTHRPRGEAFAHMGSPADARDAIAALDAIELAGKRLRVRPAATRSFRCGEPS